MPLSIELSNVHALDDFDAGSFFPRRDPFFLMQVHGEAKVGIGFQAKNAFSCKLSDSFRENHRIAIPLGAVGPVPVTMYLEPTLKFEVSESGSVSLSQRHYWAITLEQNGFSPFSARLAHSADPVKLNASVALSASLFAGGDLSVMFGAGQGSWATQAGIYGAFGPDFELAASTDHPGCLTVTAKLMADLGVRLQILVKRWHLQLASLTSKPADLGGPWCVGDGISGGGNSPGDGSRGGGDGGEPEPGSSERESAKGNATAIAAGGAHTCALLPSGEVECWGWNESGQLGDGTASGPETCPRACSATPVPVSGISTATAIAAGREHTCALLSSGEVECWGENEYGQLGDGTSTGPQICGDRELELACSTTPVPVSGVTDATAIAAGANHTCALRSSGEVECWGEAEFGQLGDGTWTGPETCRYTESEFACSTTPVSVSDIRDATAISAGTYHTCALLSSREVECWGENDGGSLGDGTEIERASPVPVSGITDATVVAAGGDHTCSVLSRGEVNCWGRNQVGQLGNGASTGPETCSPGSLTYLPACSTTPVPVSRITDATVIAAGVYHTCSVLSRGGVECWGWNGYGQLGDGTASGPQTCGDSEIELACSTTPVPVSGIASATAIAAGNTHNCALLTSGGVQCWGANGEGELGDGTTTPHPAPVPVIGLR